MRPAHPVRVLESFAQPRPTTNPYIVQLARVLESDPGCELVLFSFKRAIIGRYDVFHVHWPEVIFTGHSPFKSFAREVLTALVLTRIQLCRKALVRTRHNIELPAGLNRRQKLLSAWFERLTTMNIHLNTVTRTASVAPAVTILHGDYREWFAAYPQDAMIPGRVAYFGLIRRYKGVEGLVSRFRETRTSGLTLSVSGNPSTSELQEEVVRLTENDPRVEFTFRFLTDAELVRAATTAELVVLPYRFMHNSGATLTALSLRRPVLVPDTEVNRTLADEVGSRWVHRYKGELSAEDIDSTLESIRSEITTGEPNLAGRSWSEAGAQHVRAFVAAVEVVRRGRRRLRRSTVSSQFDEPVSRDGIPLS